MAVEWDYIHDHLVEVCNPRTTSKTAAVELIVASFSLLSLRMWRLRNNKWFKRTVNLVILFAAVMVGWETMHPGHEHPAVDVVEEITIKVVFTIEFLVKILSEGTRPWCYFEDLWNNFDFFILCITFAPFGGDAFAGLRILRLIKLIRAASPDLMPQTMIVIHAFTAGMDAFVYIGALWMLQIYIFAVAGCILFGKNDPVQCIRLSSMCTVHTIRLVESSMCLCLCLRMMCVVLPFPGPFWLAARVHVHSVRYEHARRRLRHHVHQHVRM
jgi:hypothetical protein